MDKQITASGANRQLARILSEVRDGCSYVVISRGSPVARIGPVGRDERLAQAARSVLLERLASLPVLLAGRPWRREELYDV
ncbi:MAG: type II toxin-antitoxin system prevent-host-death family antitoxin [Geminicoccaceae bacterium]